ncbi:MAG: glycosyltransferase family 4 protein, partial [Pseudomonadota bacterium]
APLKPPDHPVPSGERQIARLTLAALERAGFAAEVASPFRSLEKAGEGDAQARLIEEAEGEAKRVIATLAPDPPAAWLTYHSYYKAPDLIGPAVAGALSIPYLISEPSHAPKRMTGPWARFGAANLAALTAADRLLWTTARDRPALAALVPDRLTHLPAFVDPGPDPAPRGAGGPLRLLTVAMMRAGDKLASYRALATALGCLGGIDWRLTVVGDGRARAEVEAALAPLGPRVTLIGARPVEAVRAIYEAHDVFLWPGIGEGIGMVYLEAMAAGLPVVAEAHPAPADLVPGPLPPPGDAEAFAAAICALADPARRAEAAAAARAHVLARHSIGAAAATLARVIAEVRAR